MELAGLITSLTMNIFTCAILVAIYSLLRMRPNNKGVYFAHALKRMRSEHQKDPNWFENFSPSSSWIGKAWSLTEEDILQIGGLDAVVFVKILFLSLRVFSIASILCLPLLLPLNYYGKAVGASNIKATPLEQFTIQNIPIGSRRLWVHCASLYIFCGCTWILLYFEYKDVAKMRLAHLRQSYRNPSQFTVLVRGIPLCHEENYHISLRKYFMQYYQSSYMSHQMVYRCGKIVNLMKKAEKMYDRISIPISQELCSPCKFCQHRGGSFRMLTGDLDEIEYASYSKFEHEEMSQTGKESGAAFVFFKTRFAAATVGQAYQSSNPMLWVTGLAPEPADVYWSNLCVPYKQLWIRKLATVAATTAFLGSFAVPVAFIQSLSNLKHFQQAFPFLKGLLRKPAVNELITGYLPGFALLLLQYTVPPIMILLSTLEGSISRSGRKKAACLKVLQFNIWNGFFVNLASGTAVYKLFLYDTKTLTQTLANKAIPGLVRFFITYVLTSGWTSLAIELAQLYSIVVNSLYKLILRKKSGPYDAGWTFPFHTEIPRVLLFVLLGFTFGVLAPLILPLLVVYFFLAVIIYQNQILNVYLFEYDTGGKYWPMAHSSIIFSMVLAQIIATGVFVVKRSPTCAMFSMILALLTLVFNEFCRHRFLPVFNNIAVQELIEMDHEDAKFGREEIYKKLKTAYSQRDWVSFASKTSKLSSHATHYSSQLRARTHNHNSHRNPV